MPTLLKRLSQPTIVGLSGLILAALLATSFATFVVPRLMPQFAHAATLCAQSPSAQNCDDQDPIIQGCTVDAETTAHKDIVYNGATVGSIERRYSPTCKSWWPRVIDSRSGAQTELGLVVGLISYSTPPTFTSGQYRILYNAIHFAATPDQQQLTVTGIIEVAGAAPFPSETLPADQ